MVCYGYMDRVIHVLTTFFIALIFLSSSAHLVQAADIRHGDSVEISSSTAELKNAYLFGDTVRLLAPVQNDVVAAGGTVTVESPVEESIMAAGGTITIKGPVGNSVRVAGGNITIDGTITNDLLITGGNITITKNAKIGGDLLFAGGNLTLDGPVSGKVLFAGGNIRLNSTIGKGAEGYVGELALGSNAVVNGNLKYTSEKKAQLANGARVTGETKFEQRKEEVKPKESLLGGGVVYKLIVDILLSILFIYFFRKFAVHLLQQMKSHPLKNGAIGFVFLFIFPLAAFFMIMLLWLGVAAFLFYGLMLFISVYLAKLFVGWWIMKWYTTRNDKKKHYELEWKAGIIGPLVFFVLNFIPVLGWLTEIVIVLAALGTLLVQAAALAKKGQ